MATGDTSKTVHELKAYWDPKSTKDVKKGFTQVQKQTKLTQKRMKALNLTFTELYSKIRLITGAFSQTRHLIAFSDQMRLLSNRIKSLARDQSVDKTFEDLSISARKTLSTLKDTADGFTQLKFATEQYGLTTKEVIELNTTIANSFRLTGATQQEAAAASRQLIQAIRSNRLGGDEFRSVRENAPYLIKIFAEELGVAQDEVKKAAEAGLITTEIMLNALRRNFKKINDEAEKLGGTVLGEMVVQTNELGKAWRKFDEAAGISDAAIASIREAAKAVKNLADQIDLLVTVGGWLLFSVPAFRAGKAAWGGGKAIATAVKETKNWSAAFKALGDSVKGALPALKRAASYGIPLAGVAAHRYYADKDLLTGARAPEAAKPEAKAHGLGVGIPREMEAEFTHGVQELLLARMSAADLTTALHQKVKGESTKLVNTLQDALLSAMVANPVNEKLQAIAKKYYSNVMDAFYKAAPKQLIKQRGTEISNKLKDAGLGLNLLGINAKGPDAEITGLTSAMQKEVAIFQAQKRAAQSFQSAVQGGGTFENFFGAQLNVNKIRSAFEVNQQIFRLQKQMILNAKAGRTELLPLQQKELKILKARKTILEGTGLPAAERAANLEKQILEIRTQAASLPEEKQRAATVKILTMQYQEQLNLFREGKFEVAEMEKKYLAFLKKIAQVGINDEIRKKQIELTQKAVAGDFSNIEEIKEEIKLLETRKKLRVGDITPFQEEKEKLASSKRQATLHIQKEIFAKQRELFESARTAGPIEQKRLLLEIKLMEARKSFFEGGGSQAEVRAAKIEKELYELRLKENMGGDAFHMKNIESERENLLWEEKVRLFNEGAINMRELDEAAASMHTRFDPASIEAYSIALRLAIGDLREAMGTQVTILRSAIGRTVNNFENFFVKGIMKGKFAFRDFANAVIEDLIRVQTRILITKPIVDALNASLSGARSGTGQSGSGIAQSIGGSLNGTSPGGAGGGAPNLGVPLDPGSAPRTASLGKPYEIKIENRVSGAQVRTSENTNDGTLKIMIQRGVTEALDSGQLDQSFQRNFGFQRPGVG